MSAFRVAAVAALLLASCAASQAGRGPDAAVAARLDRLAAGVEQVEAMSALKRLQYAYGHYTELGLWHDFADLFAEDAVAHYPAGDLDREGVRALFLEQVGQGKLGLAQGRLYPHINLEPVIHLDPDGTTAHARWRILAQLGGYGGNATWAFGLYENDYVKRGGAWEIADLVTTIHVGGAHGGDLRPSGSPPGEAPVLGFHYTPDEAGAPYPAARSAPAPDDPSAAAPAADAGARLASLEHRLAAMSDEAAVTNLQHAYGYRLERHDWDGLLGLLADGATLETGQRGVYAGKAHIRAALAAIAPQGQDEGALDDRTQLLTVVTIAPDGKTARARGVHLRLSGRAGEGSELGEDIYENAFVKEDGVWKIGSVHEYTRIAVDWAKGWGADGQPPPGPLAGPPPDRPPSEVYAAYPELYVPALHFRHPVTGRTPQYPEGAPAAAVLPAYGEAAAGSAAAAERGAALPGNGRSFRVRLSEAERALERLRARHAAENVVDAYGYYVDERLWSEAAQLFAPDGWRASPGSERAVGPEAVRSSLEAGYGPAGRRAGEQTLYQIAQPVIDVADDGASACVCARVLEIGARTDAPDTMGGALLESRLERVDGVWHIAAMAIEDRWSAPFKEGWEPANRVATPGPSPPLPGCPG